MIQKITNALSETQAFEFEQYFQFLNTDQQQALLQSQLPADICYQLVLAVQASCSTKALEGNDFIQLLTLISLHKLSYDESIRLLNDYTQQHTSIEELKQRFK